ncbi:transmembrane protein, putative [Medicago truncatula]|uniref:Transmembrane protein, putative n=1 Tax=Medicago truncatula TaxID=3880 RepID=G7LIZ8_MEDTR|nr:transmembrane protein, putative [Medicago truncatula]
MAEIKRLGKRTCLMKRKTHAHVSSVVLSDTTTRTFLLPLLILTAATLLPTTVLKRRRNDATSLERTTYHSSKIKSREKLKKWNNTNPTAKEKDLCLQSL